MSELMNELAEVILATVPDAPVQGIINAIKLRFGGQLFYIPKASLKARDQEVTTAHKNGESINDLARRFRLSNNQIRRITKK